MSGVVVPFSLNPAPPDLKDLAAKVRVLAKNTSNIRWDNPHVQQRMGERSITMRQALEVLRKGKEATGPTQDQYGDWRIKIKRKVAGRRVQVVVAIKEKHLEVVTVI